MANFKFSGRWSDDCQGKKDYDGKILEVSTRYWPAGGGFMLVGVGPHGVKFEENADRPCIKPSATAHLNIVHGSGARHCLVECDFEADTEAEVKRLVEAWVQDQMDVAVKALQDAFYADPNGSPR